MTVPVNVKPLTVPVPPTLVTVPAPAPMAVRKSAAFKEDTVLSALNRGNAIADTFVNVKRFAPRVVAPRFVRAAVSVVAPVPPLAIATVPVTLVALPLNVAVIVPAEKLPEASRATMAFAVFALVAVVAEFGREMAVLVTPVTCPCALVVRTGTEDAEPYVPAVPTLAMLKVYSGDSLRPVPAV